MAEVLDKNMDSLITYETPTTKLSTMIVAFSGWTDAAESATRAVRYLARRLPAKKFAAIDPEEFFDFTMRRPMVRFNREGERVIRWPINDFYFWVREGQSDGILLYEGTEPNLKWRAFSEIIMSVVERCGVNLVVSVGALLDAVPHSREPWVTGRATSEELRQKAEWLQAGGSPYQGPTGINGIFMDACTRRGLPYASLMGHSPHYIQTTPNPKLSYALITRLKEIIAFDVDMEGIRQSAIAFEEEINRVVAKEPDVESYVRRLEERYDAALGPGGRQTEGIPAPESLVKELEEFLKEERRKKSEDEST